MKELWSAVVEQIRGFLSLDGVLRIIGSGDYSALKTYEGIVAVIAPILPLILVVELVRGLLYKRFSVISYKIPFLSYICNAILGRYLSIGMVMYCIGVFEPHALWKLPLAWYGFIFGYIVWEFAHFIYHYLGHKVRLFWCLHSTHHAPESMNLAVSYAHFFLEAPYADIIRTTICIVAGVPPEMLFVIMFIDGTWGSFIHIGDTVLKNARLGVWGKFILTPSHHRVHHARNVQYMDTNYCNLLNVWDRVFRTYQPELPGEAVEYGITRPMKANSFLDAYFGEIVALGRDVVKAPGLINKLRYILMPPGWSHTGDHKTAAALKKQHAI